MDDSDQSSKITPVQVVQLGDDLFAIKAKGRFTEKEAKDYAPTFESENILVELPEFEGPMDLLLHLIRRHHMDIFDIPVGKITEQYLKTLDLMKAQSIDIAGEFLLMAATLTHIKSKMLLPKEEEEEEEEADPRADLVRRLLEYQSFKEVAAALNDRNQLGRDVFIRKTSFLDEYKSGARFSLQEEELPKLKNIEIYEVLQSFSKILKRLKPMVAHAIQFESISVRARMHEMIDYLKSVPSVDFEKMVLGFGELHKSNVVVTFLAILELTRLNLLEITQNSVDNRIQITASLSTESLDSELMLNDIEDDLPN